MKVSIITITYNSSATIRDTLQSVQTQSYHDIEHVIVDGNSSDNTLDIVNEFPNISKIISEPDSGIYNAMNKGLKAATGDVIGILNSDDFFASSAIVEQIAQNFDLETQAIIGDIAFVSPKNTSKIVRYYSAKNWNPKKFRWGFMPPHPSFYLKKECYENIGYYKEDYQIASDYELLVRMLLKHNLNFKYLPLQMVTMRTGGISTKNIKSRYILNKEIVKACKENHVYTNLAMLSLKYFKKIFEYR